LIDDKVAAYYDAQKAFEDARRYHMKGENHMSMALLKRLWKLDPDFKEISKVQSLMETITLEFDRESSVKVDYIDKMYSQAKNLFIAEQWTDALKLFEQVQSINSDYKAVQMYMDIANDELQQDMKAAA